MTNLADYDSSQRVIDAAERHISLCHQSRNGDKYADAIIPLYDDLVARAEIFKKAKKNVSAAIDRVRLYDMLLDDTLRNVHGRSKEFDRDNPGNNTCTMLFPGGNVSEVIVMPFDDEPGAAHDIAQRILSLGANHTLYASAAEIEACVKKCKDALSQRSAMTETAGDAKTQMILAKLATVRLYNANFLNAAIDVDRNYAERLFPKLRPSRPKDDDTDSDSDNGV